MKNKKALARIRRVIERKDLKKQRVAKRAGISRSYFSKILNGHKDTIPKSV